MVVSWFNFGRGNGLYHCRAEFLLANVLLPDLMSDKGGERNNPPGDTTNASYNLSIHAWSNRFKRGTCAPGFGFRAVWNLSLSIQLWIRYIMETALERDLGQGGLGCRVQ